MPHPSKTYSLGALFCFFSVAIGAFGAHVLRSQLSPYHFSLVQLAAQYLISHGLALVAVGILEYHTQRSLAKITLGFSIGTTLFAGSLLLIAFTGLSVFGIIAPIGGSLLLISWAMLAWVGYTYKK